MFREALAIDRRRLGNEHPEVAIKLVNLSRILMDQGKPRRPRKPRAKPSRSAARCSATSTRRSSMRSTSWRTRSRCGTRARRAAQAGSAGDRAPGLWRSASRDGTPREQRGLVPVSPWCLSGSGVALSHCRREPTERPSARSMLDERRSRMASLSRSNGLRDFRGAEAAATRGARAVSQAASGPSGCHGAHGARQCALRTAAFRGGGSSTCVKPTTSTRRPHPRCGHLGTGHM